VVKIIGGRKVAQRRFQLKRDAAQWEREERARLLNPQQTGMTFSQFSNKYLEFAEVQYGASTHNEKLRCFKRFLRFIGHDANLADIVPEWVSDYLMQRMASSSANSANVDRKNLLALWNWGVRIMDLTTNPVAKCPRFRHDPDPVYVPPEKDILKMLACTTGQDRVFFECYLNTGARRGEIMNLKWEDVNFEKRTITLATRKTRDGTIKRRVLDLAGNASLWSLLDRHYRNRRFPQSPHVFLDMHPGPTYGKPFSKRYHWLNGLCKQAGVKPFSWHPIRHWVASMLADKHKISTPTIQKILGHERLSTTDRYVTRVTTDVAEALGKLGKRDSEGSVKENPSTPNGAHKA